MGGSPEVLRNSALLLAGLEGVGGKARRITIGTAGSGAAGLGVGMNGLNGGLNGNERMNGGGNGSVNGGGGGGMLRQRPSMVWR